ncbi:MAG: hypothetical protein HY298_14490 [Verrucomicrobia bacterium]|nr:hypothetical protein [Verrucomicrobiota bacterium]
MKITLNSQFSPSLVAADVSPLAHSGEVRADSRRLLRRKGAALLLALCGLQLGALPTARAVIQFILLLAALLLAGCATPPGSSLVESPDAAATPPSGQALIFIVRTPNFVDSATSWIIGVNGEYLVTLSNGRYYSFTNAPGTLSFSTRFANSALNVGLLTPFNKAHEILTLDTQADRTYYLKFFAGTLKQLPRQEGQMALAKCKMAVPDPARTGKTNNFNLKRSDS